ncbi:RmlC-like cupin domain-containing protein [Leptodontidium sp. MPI-SDFR-AT-0119]|nr:RmlC-like cupin domain-containing protein [Leptodontidium sp. MPI-SDFR-AT-0119]
MYTPIILLSIALGLSTAAPTPSNQEQPDVPAPAVTLSSTAPATSCTAKASSNDLELYQKLTSAPSAVQRQSLLSDADFVFDFLNPCDTEGATTSGKGGHTVRADRASFPALVSQGASITIGFLGPCGFNTPHVHPRAAELNLVVEGSLFASVTAENGARHMSHTLNKWQMTVFPAGAMHTEFNPECTPATFVAAFPNEDPGVGQIAQEYFSLENEIVKGSAGGELSIDGADIDKFRAAIPANVAAGVDSCLAKCGISKR